MACIAPQSSNASHQRRCGATGDILETDCRNHNRDVYRFDPETTQRVEAWHEKVRDARQALTLATENVRLLKTEYRTLPPSDGHYAYRQALQIETKARSQYNRVLRVFRHIVWYGSLPDEIGHTTQ
jgi:hypothetical protein